MRSLRLALAQIDLVVGDIAANTASVLDWTQRAAADGADLVAFPEMTLTGYPPEDLVFRDSFRRASVAALDSLAKDLASAGLGDIAVVVGYLDIAGGPRNASAWCHGGAVVATYYKHHLPNYGVFDERRYFSPGTELPIVRFRDLNIAMTICEDMWQDGGPFAAAATAEVDLLININGSPFENDKDDLRLPLAAKRAREARTAVAYVNQVGGQDELVFDGDSFVVDANGELLVRAEQFHTGLLVTDLTFDSAVRQSPVRQGPVQVPRAIEYDASMTITYVECAAAAHTPTVQDAEATATAAQPGHSRLLDATLERLSDTAQLWNALVLGTRDYVQKNRFSKATLGLSGGIDSAVVAAIASDAIGAQNILGVAMPSKYSSQHSLADAAELASRLGTGYQIVSITPMVDAYVEALKLEGLAEENIQARVRGATLMAISNSGGYLVLATGNKSELAVGYSTIYGDAVGGFAPIKDVPKSQVWELARWRNEQASAAGLIEPIPRNSIDKPPSAELRPGQLDSDSLPDYELLDQILVRYVDFDEGVATIINAGFDPELVNKTARMVDAAEWKRRQYPMGPKVSFKAFGRDRRLPVTNHWREHAEK